RRVVDGGRIDGRGVIVVVDARQIDAEQRATKRRGRLVPVVRIEGHRLEDDVFDGARDAGADLPWAQRVGGQAGERGRGRVLAAERHPAAQHLVEDDPE